jgi:hypothetical protein
MSGLYDQFASLVWNVALLVADDEQAAVFISNDVFSGLGDAVVRDGKDAIRPWLARTSHCRAVERVRRDQVVRCHRRSNAVGEAGQGTVSAAMRS